MSLEPIPRPASSNIPIAILAVAFSVFLLAQIRAVAEQGNLLRWQITNAQTQDDNLKKTEKQMKDLSVQRESLVKQSVEIQNKFQAILNDVLELAKDDKDAREVVEAWKIQRSTPPAGTGAPTTTATAPAK